MPELAPNGLWCPIGDFTAICAILSLVSISPILWCYEDLYKKGAVPFFLPPYNRVTAIRNGYFGGGSLRSCAVGIMASKPRASIICSESMLDRVSSSSLSNLALSSLYFS